MPLHPVSGKIVTIRLIVAVMAVNVDLFIAPAALHPTYCCSTTKLTVAASVVNPIYHKFQRKHA
jgi:hypothetical protein